MKLFPGKTYSLFVIREYIKVFLICMIFIIGLSFIVRTLQKSGNLKIYTAFQNVIFRLIETPEIISREALLPSCMFASVYTMSILTKNREVLALRSCGVSVYRIISPLICVGVLIGLGSLALEDGLVVRSFEFRERYAARLRGEEIGIMLRDRDNVVVYGENNIIFKIDHYAAARREMQGVIVLQKNQSGLVTLRIDAQSAHWKQGRWVFRRVVQRVFDDEGRILEEKRATELPTDIRDNPEYFAQDRRTPENMSLRDAYNYVRNIRRMGLEYEKPLTKFHRKIAHPLTLILVIIIGLALGSMPFKNALVISFGVTLLTVLVFFFIIEIGETFGSSGQVSPVIGGWLGNIVFSIVAAFMLRRVRV
jgi:lipopolysaccharide export system permease protein